MIEENSSVKKFIMRLGADQIVSLAMAFVMLYGFIFETDSLQPWHTITWVAISVGWCLRATPKE